jgi:hypothetical protein
MYSMDDVEFELFRREVGELKERISHIWVELEREHRLRIKLEAENSFLKEELERNRLVQRALSGKPKKEASANQMITEMKSISRIVVLVPRCDKGESASKTVYTHHFHLPNTFIIKFVNEYNI